MITGDRRRVGLSPLLSSLVRFGLSAGTGRGGTGRGPPHPRAGPAGADGGHDLFFRVEIVTDNRQIPHDPEEIHRLLLFSHAGLGTFFERFELIGVLDDGRMTALIPMIARWRWWVVLPLVYPYPSELEVKKFRYSFRYAFMRGSEC